jgi:hypothetical protein
VPPNQEVLGPGGSGSCLALYLINKGRTRKISAQHPRGKTVNNVEFGMVVVVWKQAVCLSVDIYREGEMGIGLGHILIEVVRYAMGT